MHVFNNEKTVEGVTELTDRGQITVGKDVFIDLGVRNTVAKILANGVQ